MADVQTISIGIAAASVVVALTYYSLQLRNQNRTRQAQLFMQLYDRFHDKEFMKKFVDINDLWEWRDYDDFLKKYGPETNLEAYSSWASVGNFYEGMGVLVKRKLIDVNLVDDLMSGFILRFWDKIEPIIKEFRERENWPQAYEWIEYLYNEIKVIIEQQHPELRK